MPYNDLKYLFSGGVFYENVKMMNSKTRETLDEHNRARPRVITRDLFDGKYNNEGMTNAC